MVRRVLRLVYQEVRGLHQAAYVLALFAFGSQLLALVRDRLLAHEFGASASLDVYYTAFRIPDLLYVLFVSTLSVYVLIPFVAKYQKESKAQASQLLSQVFTLFLIFYSTIALALWWLTPEIIPWLFPGIADQATLITLSRILLLQPLLLGISSLLGVVTQLNHRFVLYAISPLIYNVGIIIGIAVFYPLFGLAGLVWGVVLGAAGHMLVQLPLVWKSDLTFGLARRLEWSMLWPVLRTSIPRAITLSLNQIVLLVIISLATVMSVGSVAVYQFAYNLQSVPLSIIGVSYSVAAFPILADLFVNEKRSAFVNHIGTALRHIIFWSVPAIVLIVILRAQIVRVVLGTGAFDWGDTRLTAAVLAILIIGLLAQAVNLLLIRALYAGGNTRAPLWISFWSAVLAIGLAYGFSIGYQEQPGVAQILSELLRVPNIVGTEVLALALGYVIATILQSFWLLLAVSGEFKTSFWWLAPHVGRAVLAALFGGVATYAALNFFVEGLNTATFIGIFLQGLLAGLFGICGIILAYAGLRSPELTEVSASFRRRLFKTDVIAPQEEIL